MRIDLNVDVGEGYPYDQALMPLASSVNICVGEHAGSWDLTLATLELAVEFGCRVGVHPGYPDRASMGRNLPENPADPDLAQNLRDQVMRFEATYPPRYIKPHGAWYNLLALPMDDPRGTAARATALDLADWHGVPLMVLAGSEFAAQLPAPRVIREGFVDRRYREDGQLVPRSEPNALLRDRREIIDQVLRLAPLVDSLCLHGDTPGCVHLAELVIRTLRGAGYKIAPPRP